MLLSNTLRSAITCFTSFRRLMCSWAFNQLIISLINYSFASAFPMCHPPFPALSSRTFCRHRDIVPNKYNKMERFALKYQKNMNGESTDHKNSSKTALANCLQVIEMAGLHSARSWSSSQAFKTRMVKRLLLGRPQVHVILVQRDQQRAQEDLDLGAVKRNVHHNQWK
jgi:hypothetical protein